MLWSIENQVTRECEDRFKTPTWDFALSFVMENYSCKSQRLAKAATFGFEGEEDFYRLSH